MQSSQPPRYVKPNVAEKQLGVDRRTLQKWAASGAIRSVQPGGVGRERLYDVSSVVGVAATTTTDTATHNDAVAASKSSPSASAGGVDGVDAVYARVSTRKQLDDLATQLGDLQRRHPDARVFSDIGSGLNFKRKGLLSLLELAFEGRLRSVHVAHKDRLCRFAFDLLEHVFHRHGAQIVVDAHDGDAAAAAASPELELAEDVLAVVTVLGARLYGKRSAGNRRKRKRDAAAAAAPASGAAAEASAQGDQGASSTSGGATDGAGADGAEAQGDAGPAPAGLGWAAADLQGAHGLDSDAEADAEGLLRGGAVGVQ